MSDQSTRAEQVHTWGRRKQRGSRSTTFLLTCALIATTGCSGKGHFPTRPAAFPHYRNFDAIPTWSPDGQFIAYLHEPRDSSDSERIAIIDTSGSAGMSLINITPAVSPQLAWSPDGTQIAYYNGGICTVVVATRATRVWTGPFASYPSWSPDGRYLIYLITVREALAPDSTAGLHIIDTQAGDQRTLIRDDTLTTFGSFPIWSPDGESVAFMSNEAGSGGNICLVSVDGTRFRQVTRLNGWCADLQWSTDGRRIYFHFTPSPATFGDPARTKSWVVNADGTGLRQLSVDLGDPRVHFWFQFSIGHPADRVAYTGLDATGTGGVIWTMDVDGTNRRQLTTP